MKGTRVMDCPICKTEMSGPGTIIGHPYPADAYFCDPDEDNGCGTEIVVPISAYEREPA